MKPHGKHLRLENGTAIGRGILGVEVETVDARLVAARDNFGLKPRQQDATVVAGWSLRQQFAECGPVFDTVKFTDFFAG